MVLLQTTDIKQCRINSTINTPRLQFLFVQSRKRCLHLSNLNKEKVAFVTTFLWVEKINGKGIKIVFIWHVSQPVSVFCWLPLLGFWYFHPFRDHLFYPECRRMKAYGPDWMFCRYLLCVLFCWGIIVFSFA